MSYLSKIEAADVLDLKSKLKQKKEDDKEQKKEDMKPKFDHATVRVMESSSYGGGYELKVSVPIPANFLRSKTSKFTAKGTDEFVRMLHEFVNEKIGKWLGAPTLGGLHDRAKNGFITITASWYFEDAFFAYSLGMDISQWRGSANVVDRNQIDSRLALAEKAYKEMLNFRDVSFKKLKLRSQNAEERNKIWKEEYMEDWVKLSDKWKEKGISYTALDQSSGKRKKATASVVVSYVEKIKVLSDSSYKKDAARYLWFVLKGDGTIWTGYEDRNDAKDELKDLKETDKAATMIPRAKVDPAKLAQFYKNNGVPQRMVDKGLRDAKEDAKLARNDPWAYEAKKSKEGQKERIKKEGQK